MKIAILILLGIVGFYQQSQVISFTIAMVGLLVAGILLYWHKTRWFAWLSLGFFWASLDTALLLKQDLPPELEGQDVFIQGTVVSLPQSFELGQKFIFLAENLSYRQRQSNYAGRLLIRWYSPKIAVKAGQQWQLLLRLKRPHGSQNPAGFDYEKWLFQQKINATGYVRAYNGNQLLGNNPWYYWQQWRQQLKQRIEIALANSEFQGLVLGLVLGERQQITSEQWQVLQQTGTSHLLAISGLHVGLVSGFAYLALCWLWRLSTLAILWLPAQRFAAVATMIVAVVYAMLAGFSIPTQRAFVMVSVVMLALFWQQAYRFSQLFAFALIAVLLWQTMAVLSIGFWLSFMAVMMIAYSLMGRLTVLNYWQASLKLVVMMAVMMMPLTLGFFNQVSWSSPMANLIAIPLISFVILPLLLLTVILLAVIPSWGQIALQWIEHYLLSLLWQYLQWVADLGQTWQPAIHSFALLVLTGFALLLLFAPKGIAMRYLALPLLLPLIFFKPQRPQSGEYWLTLLDVGQGLSVVIQTQSHQLVYDTGAKFSANFNAGDAIVLPYLKQQGITIIDALVVSHGDNDHNGGTKALLQQMSAINIFAGEPAKIASNLAKPCYQGQQWQWDGVDFKILYPPNDGYPRSGNNASCVLLIDNAYHKVLLTGDIERMVESWLITQAQDLGADVLIAPHHGSASSSSMAFIKAVSPQYVLFATAYRNHYNFPNLDVVKRYQSIQAIPLNTANTGAILFQFGSSQMRVAPVLYRQTLQRLWFQR